MSVHVDEARRDELPSCVDGRGCFDAREVADGIDATLTYADIGPPAWRTRAVNNLATTNDQIEHAMHSVNMSAT